MTVAATPGVCQLDVHGLVLRIECADPLLLEGIDERFGNLSRSEEKQPDLVVVYAVGASPHERPADGRVVYESAAAEAVYSPGEDALYAFSAEGPSMRCAAAEGHAEIAGDPDNGRRSWLLTRPLLTLAIMELLRRRRLYPVHAACLARDGVGVLLCGSSGSGKSTLSLALLQAGLSFLGDDLAFLREDPGGLTAMGFPDEVGLAEDARDVLSSVPSGVDLTPRPGWPKARADVRLLAPHVGIAQECAPSLVILLGDGATQSVERPDPDSALVELLPSILLTHADACAGHLSALAKLAMSATLFRTAARPDPNAVVDLVLHALPRLTEPRKDVP